VLSIAISCWLENPVFESREGHDILQFSKMSKTVLGTTQPPTQWTLGASLGVNPYPTNVENRVSS